MKLGPLSAALGLLFVLLVACNTPANPTPPTPGPSAPALPELTPDVWTPFAPGGETVCADGSPYTYYVRPGTVNKLVLEFEGGGACWNGSTCSGAVYRPSVSGGPAKFGDAPPGIYDHANPANPVRDWYHVFVSYCTADVHLGNSTETYTTDSGEVTIEHNGQANVAAVLDWVGTEFEAPEAVFVTGCSAGAYGAALYTPQIATRYPNADVTQLGDCGAGIIPGTFVTGEDGLQRWNIADVLPEGVDLDGGVPATFLADAYAAIGTAYPEVTLAQYNSAVDGTQILFYALQLGLNPEDPADREAAGQAWVAGLQTSLTQLQGALPGRFSSYTSLLDYDNNLQNGTAHCVIDNPAFYTLATSGTPFVTWLDGLLNADAPPAPVVPPLPPLPST